MSRIITRAAAKQYKAADPAAQAAFAEFIAFVYGSRSKARKLSCEQPATEREAKLYRILQRIPEPVIHTPVNDGGDREAFAQLTEKEEKIVWLDTVNPKQDRVYLE